MKISRNWLQTFFVAPLPDAQALSDALTFHAFEIENISDSKGSPWNIQGLPLDNDAVLDVKVTPNRGHDCLSHRGIAKEISAILNIPMKTDPLREPVSLAPIYSDISLYIENDKLCRRYIAGYIRGVKVGHSPDWLKESLESMGQKSINNIVDAANFVMFNMGQPLHVFDTRKLASKNGQLKIQIRNAKKGEKIATLDDKEYELPESVLVIADGNADRAIGIAGVKGGKAAEVDEQTMDIIIESANFDGASVRKTAQALKLRTDASQRFEQGISSELAGFGMRAVTDLILKIACPEQGRGAGGELVGFADEYPKIQDKKTVSISLPKINSILGTKFTESEVESVFKRLGLQYEYCEATPRSMFKVEAPFERLDLVIPEDLVEEVARIFGYDKIPTLELPKFPKKPEINASFYAAEKVREDLVSKGYSEVFTSVFADRGERAVLNKVGGDRPFLRGSLIPGLAESLEKNNRNRDILGIKNVRLFEIGTVWRKGQEEILLGTADEKGVREEQLKTVSANSYENLPISTTERYQPFSKYPFIVRDVALWAASGTKSEDILEVMLKESGALLVRSELFDTFGKAGKISYAFRLVLQSFEKTLTDVEANAVMENVYKAVKNRGWEPR